MRRPAAIAAAATIALAAGCGNGRTSAPEVAVPGPPIGSTRESFPAAGLALRTPAGWLVDGGAPPLVTAFSSGSATIAVWRYPRSERLPRTEPELDTAATAVVTAAKARDPTFTETGRRKVTVDGVRGVEIRGTGTISGQPRTVRSTHLYTRRAELVIDGYAPREAFPAIDTRVLAPLLRSVQLSRPTGA